MKKSMLLFLMITLYGQINAQAVFPEKPREPQPESSARYLYLKGNFNTYAALNNTIHGYADGIVTYIFDRKTKKLKNTRIEQYRIFRLPKAEWDPQKFSSWDYAMYMHVPQIKRIGNIERHKKNKNMVFHQSESGETDKVEIKEERFREKELAILGFHFYDVKNHTRITYTGNSRKQPENLLDYRESSSMKLKYKNEPMYNAINVYANFYPTALGSGDDKGDHKVEFDLNKSCYTSKYWEDPSFPDTQDVLNAFLKAELTEKQNIDSLNT